MKSSIKRIVFATLAVTMIAVPTTVSAHDGDEKSETTVKTSTISPSPKPETKTQSDRVKQLQTELKDKLDKLKEQRAATVDTKKAELHIKLDDAKKKVCEKHQTDINNVMSAMNVRRQTAFTHISNVATAINDYYVKQHLTVANYTDLAVTIDTAKTAALTAMLAQQTAPQLNCSGDHPRADVADFKDKRASSIDAMQAYRNAVRELLKAVRSAAEATKTTGDSSHE